MTNSQKLSGHMIKAMVLEYQFTLTEVTNVLSSKPRLDQESLVDIARNFHQILVTLTKY